MYRAKNAWHQLPEDFLTNATSPYVHFLSLKRVIGRKGNNWGGKNRTYGCISLSKKRLHIDVHTGA